MPDFQMRLCGMSCKKANDTCCNEAFKAKHRNVTKKEGLLNRFRLANDTAPTRPSKQSPEI